MELITNLKNSLRIRFGSPSPAELATMSMPSEAEIREAECIAAHPFAHPDVIGKRGPTTQSTDLQQTRMYTMFPALDKVVFSEHGEVGTQYQLWYVRTMEIWAERKADEHKQAVLELSDSSEVQLEMGQYRLDVIDHWDGARRRKAQRVVDAWRRFVPAFGKAYPRPEAISA